MLSQTVEYALRAMIYLASFGDSAVNCETLSGQTRVPAGYLSKVMRDLVCANLVRSYRGPHGGFTIARHPDTISLLDVVNAVDPIHRIGSCPLDNPLHSTLCPLHKRLDDAIEHVERTFRETSLGSVLSGPGGTGACKALFPSRPTARPNAGEPSNDNHH